MKKENIERIVAFLLGFFILLLSALAPIAQYLRTPQGRTYMPVHNSLSDYPYYTNIVKQGIEGQMAVVDRFAVEQHSPSAIHILYLLIGWIGRLAGLTNAHVVYNVSRFVLGGIWIGVMYVFFRSMLHDSKERLIALFLALYSASFPRILQGGGKNVLTWYMTWWTELDPIARASFIPHFVVGHIGMVLTLLLFRLLEKTFSLWLWIFMAVVLWITGLVHPPSLLLLCFIMPVYCILLRRWRLLFGSISGLAIGATAVFYLQWQMRVFPWNLPRDFEQLSYAVSIWEYILALGPIVAFAPIGFIVRRKKPWVLLAGLWVGVSFFLLWFVYKAPYYAAPISNIRFLQVAVWVPLSMLASVGIVALTRRVGIVLGGMILVALVVLTFIGYPTSIQNQMNRIYSSYEFMYATNGWHQAMQTVGDVTPAQGVVLALPLSGQMIPSFTNRTVFVGQDVYTPQWLEKLKWTYEFYHGKLTACESYSFLKDNGITTVFYGFDEQDAGNAIVQYSFLRLRGDFTSAYVYTFQDVKPLECY